MNLQIYARAPDPLPRRIILLVEDEPFVRDATCIILEHAGFEVLSTENAQEATKAYEACQRVIDLVMTDMVLPGRSGQQLGQDLRVRSPQVVVLVTSGYGNLEYEMERAEGIEVIAEDVTERRALEEQLRQ